LAPYWALFAYFAIGAILGGSYATIQGSRPNIFYTVGAVTLVVFIGFRYEVGGDWSTYEFIFHRAGEMTLSEALSIGDPGYQGVNWAAYQVGGDVWLANLICGAIFVWGLFRFCRTQPDPWLGVAVAIPYMVIVIGMGYTRQAVALGILMAGTAAFIRGASLLRFALYVIAAALFHRTAVVGFPLVALATQRNRLTNLLLVVAGGFALYDAFLGDAMDHFVQNYIKAHYSSQGAAIRILMNMVAAVILWTARGRLQFSPLEWKIWRNFSIASAISLVMLPLIPSSAAIDRISLYLIPFQIAVLARAPLVFGSRRFGTSAMVTYGIAIQFVWLNFAQFARLWIPYRFFPF
jgi:hypothetical protein